MTRFIFATLAALCPSLVGAHPHIFIETALRVVIDDTGQLEAVEVEWVYDELYSLLLMEELEVDQDLDGVLTKEDMTKLDRFDLNWVEGYEGDVYVTRGAAPLTLGSPESLGVAVRDGRLISKHRRALSGPADGVLVQAYDPTFYTAYDLSGRVEVTGNCGASIEPADIDRAYADLEELLFARPQSVLEDAFPEVGGKFADRIWLSCN